MISRMSWFAFQRNLLTDLILRIGASAACLVLLLLALSVRAGGGMLFFQVFATVAFPVVAGVMMAPALGGLISHPFGGTFHSGGRSSGAGPGLSVAEAMRIRGDAEGAIGRLEEAIAAAPEDVGAWSAAVRIAMVDLDRPELAHDFFSRGPGALMRQPDRDTLAAMYRTAEADAPGESEKVPRSPGGRCCRRRRTCSRAGFSRAVTIPDCNPGTRIPGHDMSAREGIP